MYCLQQHVSAQPVELRGVGDGGEPRDPAALLHELLVHGAAGRGRAQQVVLAAVLRAAGAVAARRVGAAAPARRAGAGRAAAAGALAAAAATFPLRILCTQ